MSAYKRFLSFVDKLKESDLIEHDPWKELKDDCVILDTHGTIDYFKQEVIASMLHICEDNYNDHISQILQDIPAPVSLEWIGDRAVIHRENDSVKE